MENPDFNTLEHRIWYQKCDANSIPSSSDPLYDFVTKNVIWISAGFVLLVALIFLVFSGIDEAPRKKVLQENSVILLRI